MPTQIKRDFELDKLRYVAPTQTKHDIELDKLRRIVPTFMNVGTKKYSFPL